MLPRLATRILRTVDKRCLWKFAWNFGVQGTLSVERFKRRIKRGEYFPPFLYISILNSCNLRCQGCWVDVEAERNAIDLETLNRTINDAKEHGNAFFGILGGEPFMHPELLDVLAAHPDCYFQIFTNGQFITEKVAKRLREIGNATPLVSIEGREITSDERRGNKDVFNRTLRGLDHCLKAGLLTGVATSVCQSNIDELLTEAVARRTDRARRALRLVSHLSAGRAEDEFRSGAAAGPTRARAQVRRRDAREIADRDRRCVLRTRRQGALPDDHRHQPSRQSEGRHRAVSDHSIRHGEHSRLARRVRDDAQLGVPERFPRTLRAAPRAAAWCWSVPTW